MKLELIITSVICFGAAALGLILQSEWESTILEHNAELQLSLTETGIKQVWVDTLAAAVDDGTLPSGFSVEFDRSNQNILSPFFPEKKSALDWSKYREAKTGNKSEAEAFLTEALAIPRSWDKILAIQAYHDLVGVLPDTTFDGYEETIVSEEAHKAYRQIFSALSKGLDFSDLGSKSHFYGCFVRISSTGTIQAYIPKREDILRAILPQFEAKIFRKGTTIGDTSLEIVPGTPTSELSDAGNVQPILLFLVSLIALIASAGITWKIVQIEKSEALSKVTFLNQVVHELNTPLAAVKLHAQLMAKEFEQNESVASINKSIERMIKLFNEITEINRYGSRPAFTEISPEEFIKIIQNIRLEDQDRIVMEGNILAPISCDAARLNIVLRNLVQNGVRYGDKVVIEIIDNDDRCHIFVRDEGPGIKWSEKRKIFRPFYRSKDATRTTPDGLGLGLSIAAKIAHELRATLILLNPGKPGATFRLTIKRKTPNA